IQIKSHALASPEKKKQHRNNQKNSNGSRPDKPSASAAITSCDHAARREEKKECDNANLFHCYLQLSCFPALRFVRPVFPAASPHLMLLSENPESSQHPLLPRWCATCRSSLCFPVRSAGLVEGPGGCVSR